MTKKYDLPSQPWYWGDWFKATDVQSLPRDIRCTWFEMIGRMWESKNRGELSINGQPISVEQLSQLLGFGSDVEECKRHIDFLDRFSIFSRKKNGIIYCRKMVKEEEIRVSRSKAGTKGMKSRYNKTNNKTLTNTEDEDEDEDLLKEEESEKEIFGTISPSHDLAETYWFYFPAGYSADRQKVVEDFHYQIKGKMELYPKIEEYMKLNPDNLKKSTAHWDVISKFHEWNDRQPSMDKESYMKMVNDMEEKAQERIRKYGANI